MYVASGDYFVQGILDRLLAAETALWTEEKCSLDACESCDPASLARLHADLVVGSYRGNAECGAPRVSLKKRQQEGSNCKWVMWLTEGVRAALV